MAVAERGGGDGATTAVEGPFEFIHGPWDDIYSAVCIVDTAAANGRARKRGLFRETKM